MAILEIRRGDVVLVDLRGAEAGEKQGSRPCVVVQNDKGNSVSPLTIVVPLTDDEQYKRLPVQVIVTASELGAGGKNSVAECGHIRAIDRDARITKKVTTLGRDPMARIDAAIKASLGLA